MAATQTTYCKTKKQTVQFTDAKMEKLPKIQGLYIHTNTVYKLNFQRGWVGRSVMTYETKTTASVKVT